MNPAPVLAIIAAVLVLPAWGDHGCGPGLEPVTKLADGSPACVMPDTVPVLVERGWGDVPAEGMHGMQDVAFSESDVRDAVRGALAEYARLGDGMFETVTASAAGYDASSPYVFVLRGSGEPIILAHGAAAHTVDTVATPLMQADRPYRQVLADLRAAGEAGTWIEYALNNPAVDVIQAKRSFLVLQDGYIFGSGYYSESPGAGIMGLQLPELDLTDEERRWLEDNPQIRVSYDPAWPPYEYYDSDGLAGLPTYYIPIFEGLTGADFVVVPTETWTGALDSIRDGSNHALLAVGIDEERTSYMAFTEPHTSLTWNIVALAGSEDPRPLEESSVGTIKNYAIQDWLDANQPGVQYASYENQAEAFGALSSGQIDSVLQVWGVAVATADAELRDFGPIGDRLDLAVGYPRDQEVLGSILQKAVAAVPEEARRAIESKAVFDLRVTDAERRWMAENPVLRVAYDPDAYPYEYATPDGVGGMSAQYLRILGDVAGFDFEIVRSGSWDEALGAAREGEADLIVMAVETPQRTAYLGFTAPHTLDDWNMLTLGTEPVDAGDLASMRVGVIKSYAIADWMSTNMPRVSLAPYDDHAAALGALSSGEIDVLVDSFSLAELVARGMGLEGLYDAGVIGEKVELSMAYPRGQEELGSILQKVLDTIPEEERRMITERALEDAG